MLAGVLNHLWQSSALAAVVFVATAILRRHSPRLRYWLWFAASAKFLVPFSLLFAAGAQVQFQPGSHTLPATTVTKISTVFAPMAGGTVAVPSTKPIPW